MWERFEMNEWKLTYKKYIFLPNECETAAVNGGLIFEQLQLDSPHHH